MAAVALTPRSILAQSRDLVTLPEVYFKIKRAVQQPDCGLRELASVIEADPGISARLLRLANSALFGFVARIDSVLRAVTLLGPQPVHDLVLATAVSQSFSRMDVDPADLRRYWRHSLHAAVLSRTLATECNVLDGERLFVEGLLHGIGHPLMLRVLPQPCAEAARLAEQQQRALDEVQREQLGLDYAEVGAALLAGWQLPDSIVVTVRHHCRPGGSDRFQREAGIVHIAERVSTACQRDPGADWAPRIDPLAWSLTGLSADRVQAVLAEAVEQARIAMDQVFAP